MKKRQKKNNNNNNNNNNIINLLKKTHINYIINRISLLIGLILKMWY